MIKSKTYTTTPGLDYIQDAELAFAQIYIVKREGIQYDRYISGGVTNRTYIHNASLGRITFLTTFNSSPIEKVFVLYKSVNGTEPETPPGVCVPPTLYTASVPDGVANVYYEIPFFITGARPFNLTIHNRPDWMTVVINALGVLRAYGTPTEAGTPLLNFEIGNECGSIGFSQNLNILPNSNNFLVTVLGTSKRIYGVTGLSFTITDGGFPVFGSGTVTGVHEGFIGVISVDVAGTTGGFGVSYPQKLQLIKNSVVLQELPISGNAVYSFSSQTFLSTDFIQISLTI